MAGPVIDHFVPTWVLVSAGFDAHRDDPLAEFALSSGDFSDLARFVGDIAPRPGRVALFLEGGYDLAAVRMSVRSSLASLLGVVDAPEPATNTDDAGTIVHRILAERAIAMDQYLDSTEQGDSL